jgi:hypothetical protein
MWTDEQCKSFARDFAAQCDGIRIFKISVIHKLCSGWLAINVLARIPDGQVVSRNDIVSLLDATKLHLGKWLA